MTGAAPSHWHVNIDLKGFIPEWYPKLGGDLETVKRSISLGAEKYHVEVTVLFDSW